MVKTEKPQIIFSRLGRKMVCGFSLHLESGTADRIYVYRTLTFLSELDQ